MSGVFKLTCVFYWVIWLICLSYALGIAIYEEKYVIPDPDFVFASNIIKILCFVNVFMAFVGCIFVKCDITHLICCLCFMVPMGVAVPGVCAWAIYLAGNLAKSTPTGETAIDLLITHGIRYGEAAEWMRQTESAYHCCGVQWYKDYYIFFKKELNVPLNCCVNKNDTYLNQCPQHIFDPLRNDTRSRYQIEIENRMYNGTKPEDIPIEYPNITENVVHMKGCFEYLLLNTKNVYQAHFSISIVLLVSSLLMALIYIRNWCAYGPCAVGNQLHSLDVEDVPFLDDTETTENQRDDEAFATKSTPAASPRTSVDLKSDLLDKEKKRPAKIPLSVAESIASKRLRKYV